VICRYLLGSVPFANKIRFAVINYPSWREIIRKGGGFDTIVEHAFNQIRAQSDSDTYFLAGYCFGGIAAYEVARRLVQSGGRIRFLGLIDARAKGRPPPQPPEGLLAKSIRRLRRIIKQPLRESRIYLRNLPPRIIASLASLSAYRSLIMIGRLTKTLPRKVAFEWNWYLTEEVSREALRKWTIEPQAISAILFRSDEEWCPPDYGWSALCRQLTVVVVQGNHDSLLNPPNLCAEFLKMVETASSSVPHAALASLKPS